MTTYFYVCYLHRQWIFGKYVTDSDIRHNIRYVNVTAIGKTHKLWEKTWILVILFKKCARKTQLQMKPLNIDWRYEKMFMFCSKEVA